MLRCEDSCSSPGVLLGPATPAQLGRVSVSLCKQALGALPSPFSTLSLLADAVEAAFLPTLNSAPRTPLLPQPLPRGHRLTL